MVYEVCLYFPLCSLFHISKIVKDCSLIIAQVRNIHSLQTQVYFLNEKWSAGYPFSSLPGRAGLNLRGCVSPRFARFSGETRISSRRLVFKDSFHLVL